MHYLPVPLSWKITNGERETDNTLKLKFIFFVDDRE
jgi:hypothetical protein